jgi:hypothetical protein
MNTFTSNKFLKLLINTDFLFLTSTLQKKNLKHNSILSLNILELIKSLNQFIRILQFLNNQKQTKLILYTSQLLEFEFLKKNLISNCIEIKKSENQFKNVQILENFILNLQNINKSTLLKRYIKNNIFFLGNINTLKSNKQLGFYHIFNDIKELKKLIFMATLIKNILINNKCD